MGKITIQSDKRVDMKNNDNQQATSSNLFKKKMRENFCKNC